MTVDENGSPPDIEPWPEQSAPPGVKADCRTFGMAGHGRFVWGEGDPHADIVFVLDNPGAREDKEGVAFICGTRRTLRAAIQDAGLDPERVYITYLVKCRPLRAYDKPLARRVGKEILMQQVGALAPRVLALFGDVVVQTLIGEQTGASDVSVRTLRTSTRPEGLSVFDIPAVVTYHPLAARRRPNLYPLLVHDLRRLACFYPEGHGSSPTGR